MLNKWLIFNGFTDLNVLTPTWFLKLEMLTFFLLHTASSIFLNIRTVFDADSKKVSKIYFDAY